MRRWSSRVLPASNPDTALIPPTHPARKDLPFPIQVRIHFSTVCSWLLCAFCSSLVLAKLFPGIIAQEAQGFDRPTCFAAVSIYCRTLFGVAVSNIGLFCQACVCIDIYLQGSRRSRAHISTYQAAWQYVLLGNAPARELTGTTCAMPRASLAEANCASVQIALNTSRRSKIQICISSAPTK